MGTTEVKRVHRTGRLAAIRAYIDNNLEWGLLTPVKAAEAHRISVRQLHMLFEPTGITFARYVLERRLERARERLASEPHRNVLDVALSCGIGSSTVFYRAFRDAFGMTPTEFRRSAGDHGEGDRIGHAVQPAEETCGPPH